jgi:hypothetical protein
LIGFAVARVSSHYKKVAGKALDFNRSYFVPPLAPAEAYRVESLQIEMMDLRPIVSITDHDSIAAPRRLQSFVDPAALPISLEWTVPFGPSFFHVGVHNLPADKAEEIATELCSVQCSYCRAFGISCIGSHDARCFPNVREWLQHLASLPETLIVLNHPLWDVSGIGETSHRNLLEVFLSKYSEWIHALEVNGLRSWQENQDVMSLASKWKRPIISGGDRHGFEPNGVVNMTNARSFSQFAQEIRSDRASVVVFMRQYQQPLMFRKLRVAWDVLKTSKGISGDRRQWSDRIFLPWIDGRVLPLSSQEWSGTLSNKPVERPQPAECLPCEALQGTEY